MRKKITKKGIIFTITAIVLSAIVMTTFFMQMSTPIDKSVQSTSLRVKSINNYIEQLDSYIPLHLELEGREALINISNYMIYTKKYYNSGGQSFDNNFKDCLFQGDIHRLGGGGGGSRRDCAGNLQGKLDDLDALALEYLNINSSLTLSEINLYQIDPWSVILEANVTIDIVDSYAQWHLNKTFIGNISILGISDPTYVINVDAAVDPGYANVFNTEPQYNWTTYPSTLNYFALNETYFEYDQAPNFLNRMRGNLDATDSTGIATFIIPKVVANAQISNLDYSYFRRDSCTEKNLYTLDFNTNINATERSNLGINETPDPSIHNAVIPRKLMELTQLNNTLYNTGVISCP